MKATRRASARWWASCPRAGACPTGQEFPFDTLRPVRDGYVERDGVKSWYAVYGEQRSVDRVRADLPDHPHRRC